LLVCICKQCGAGLVKYPASLAAILLAWALSTLAETLTGRVVA
jgi:hypothetical protein